MQRQIPTFIVFISGLTMLIDYFLPRIPFVHGAREVFLNWGRIAITCAMFLGILNLLFSSLKKIALQKQGWIYSLILLVSFAVTLYYSIPYKVVVHGSSILTHKGTDVGTAGYTIFTNVYPPLSSTMFALVAFFIASAAFRAFRAKNMEAVLLLGAAIIVMIGSIPFGDLFLHAIGLDGILGHYNLSWLANQIQQIPMSAAQRAINFGVAFGMVFMSIKILAGIDRSYFGGGE